MFTTLAYMDAAETVIAATRADGSIKVIEEGPDADLWAMALAGTWGAIADYVPPPPPTDEEIRAQMKPLTRRQVFIGLAMEGLMTSAEAVAASAQGTPPAAIEAIFAALPEPDQTAARITFASFTVAYRNEPLVAAIGAAGNLDDAALDAFWLAYVSV